MSHYLFNFFCTTSGVIVLLYVVYLYIKNSPNLGLSNAVSKTSGHGLRVESVVNLEPRKRLYVVAYGTQRFLLATTMDKTELLSTLQAEPALETQLEHSESATVLSGLSTDSTLQDRFQHSLRWLFQNHIPGFGGK